MLTKFAYVFAVTVGTMFVMNFIAGTSGPGSTVHTIIKGS